MYVNVYCSIATTWLHNCNYQIYHKGREGKGRERKGWEGMGWDGKGREGNMEIIRYCKI